ncbi:hypothetical protein NXX24_21100 [Bacteroides fragilis]|nr:hypothetical protein [Bacteroides fragilis]
MIGRTDKHAVGALVGTSYEHYKYERLAGSREEFPSDALTDMEAGSTSEQGIPMAQVQL